MSIDTNFNYFNAEYFGVEFKRRIPGSTNYFIKRARIYFNGNLSKENRLELIQIYTDKFMKEAESDFILLYGLKNNNQE